MKKAKGIVLALILVAVAVCVVGTTLAWLNDQSDEVVNTFTPSTVGLTLTEAELTKEDAFKMVPGWTIDKTPIVTVEKGSEDCFVFIEVTESENLDEYISYAVKTAESEGKDYEWTKLEKDADGNDVDGVYYMEVTGLVDATEDKAFEILAGGKAKFFDPEVEYPWGDNEVLVKPDVTEEDMEALKETNAVQPTLSFKAYAVQLYKSNGVEFEPDEAWQIAKPEEVTP